MSDAVTIIFVGFSILGFFIFSLLYYAIKSISNKYIDVPADTKYYFAIGVFIIFLFIAMIYMIAH